MATDDRQDSKSSSAFTPRTGARNDDSSLFSLDRIRQAEESATRASRERDDSGLIDLQALAALSGSAPAQVSNAPLVVSASAGLFGAPAITAPVEAPAAPVVDVANPFERSSKRKTLFMVMGGVGAVALAAVAFMAMSGTGAPPADATAAMAPALTAAAPPPAPAPAPEPEAPKVAAVAPGQRAPAAEPKAAAPAAPAAPVAKAAAPVAKAAAPVAKAAAPAAPKEPAKPAGPVCDLTCQMQKAVSKK